MVGHKILDENIFANILKHTPLISIDLCVVREGDLVMCMRDNELAKEFLVAKT